MTKRFALFNRETRSARGSRGSRSSMISSISGNPGITRLSRKRTYFVSWLSSSLFGVDGGGFLFVSF
jgi:hypothetical protein